MELCAVKINLYKMDESSKLCKFDLLFEKEIFESYIKLECNRKHNKSQMLPF